MLLPFILATLGLQPAPQPTFAMIVREQYVTWDRNADGLLDPAEIDAVCVDPAIQGPQAAAAAALKRIVRSGRYEVPPLTLENLTATTKPPTRPTTDAQADREDSSENAAPASAPKPAPNFQSSFASSLRRISAAKRDLFLDDTPDLDRLRQGALGNCFLVASIGAMVHRDSQSVVGMITPRDEGGYTVRFGDGQRVEIGPLTDAELALSGTTGDEGLWLPVLEKAVGSLRRDANPQRYTTELATDAIANGGSTATMIRLLTGHSTDRITLKRRPRGADASTPPTPASDVETMAGRVRDRVSAALAEQRLVTAGTGTEPQPPGINGKHAYAVLAFDADADTLTLWNPHSNSFTPKGAPGLTTGYATRRGMFAVPIPEFVQIFTSVVIEAPPAKPAPPDASPPASDAPPSGS